MTSKFVKRVKARCSECDRRQTDRQTDHATEKWVAAKSNSA